MNTENKVRNNETQMQFEIGEGDNIATLVYRFYQKDIALIHTLVPDPMKGKDVASTLAEYAFRYANEKNKKVIVYCSFIANYVKKHPEVKEQLDKEIITKKQKS